jgi:hypothetical protein
VEDAQVVLQAFVDQMLPAIDRELNRALRRAP